MANYSAPQKLLGIRLSDTYTSSKHELGSIVQDEAGNRYVYVQADAAITAGQAVHVATGFQAGPAAQGEVVSGIAGVAFADNEYGWVQIGGVAVANCDSSLDAGNPVSAVVVSATAGRLSEVPAVDEGGSATYLAGALGVIGYGLVDESSNSCTVYLF